MHTTTRWSYGKQDTHYISTERAFVRRLVNREQRTSQSFQIDHVIYPRCRVIYPLLLLLLSALMYGTGGHRVDVSSAAGGSRMFHESVPEVDGGHVKALL